MGVIRSVRAPRISPTTTARTASLRQAKPGELHDLGRAGGGRHGESRQIIPQLGDGLGSGAGISRQGIHRPAGRHAGTKRHQCQGQKDGTKQSG